MRLVSLSSLVSVVLFLGVSDTAQANDVTWKLFLSEDERASSKAFLAGPTEIDTGHTIVSEDGLAEVHSQQKGRRGTTGFVYTAAPLAEQYNLTFHYTLLYSQLGLEHGHRVMSVAGGGNWRRSCQTRSLCRGDGTSRINEVSHTSATTKRKSRYENRKDAKGI